MSTEREREEWEIKEATVWHISLYATEGLLFFPSQLQTEQVHLETSVSFSLSALLEGKSFHKLTP